METIDGPVLYLDLERFPFKIINFISVGRLDIEMYIFEINLQINIVKIYILYHNYYNIRNKLV